MRVLHLSSGNLYGGVETFLATLARHGGPGAPMEPHFALSAEGRSSAELRAAGAPVHLLGAVRARNPLSVRRARRALDALLRRERFDAAVAHSAWAQAIWGPRVKAAGVPLVFYMHGDVKGRHWTERWARFTRPELAVANSRFTAGTLPVLYPGVRCELVSYPVAPPPPGLAAERDAVRAELGTAPGDVVFVQSSRLEAWKGHRLHLEALGRLRDLPGWTCWQAGGVQRASEAAYLRELRELAERLGIADRVRWAGQRSDVPRVLAAADVHCQPNLGPEPFGIAYVEALYAGLPVVSTDMGGAAEIVDPRCGILTPPGDAEALAGALRRLAGDAALRARLGAAGPARAAELCDPARQVERLARALAGAGSPAGHSRAADRAAPQPA
jgi:glycosyltransferase involved in cell wall biosynthesis